MPMLNLLREFNQVVGALQATPARYAVVGGLAVAIHGRIRTTRDVDLLVHPDDAELVAAALRRIGYRETAEPWTFRNTDLTLRRLWKGQPEGEDAAIVDLLIANTRGHQDIIAAALAEPWETGVLRVARKVDLIRMKRVRGSAVDNADIEVLEHDEDQTGSAGRDGHPPSE